MAWLANKPQLTPTDWADRRRERITDGRGGMKPYYSAYGITIYCICKGGSA